MIIKADAKKVIGQLASKIV